MMQRYVIHSVNVTMNWLPYAETETICVRLYAFYRWSAQKRLNRSGPFRILWDVLYIS